MTRPELTGVPGVPETTLTEELVARLPQNLAPAPWSVRGSAMFWRSKANDATLDALPPALRRQAKALSVIGGMVRYQDTPVGTYDEVFGNVVCRVGRKAFGTVAFMAVDSPASLVGGRTNWSMPKTLATFDGDIAGGASMVAVGDAGIDWRLRATPRLVGPGIPFGSRAPLLQQFPDGTLRGSRISASGRIRLGRIEVEVDGQTLPDWLTPGRHLGGVIPRMKFSLGEPEPWGGQRDR